MASLSEVDLVLRTPRLSLEPLSPADAADLWPYVSDPELPRFMVWDAHQSRAETDDFIQRQEAARAEGTGMTWVLREDGELRGLMSLDDITGMFVAWRVDRAELGYWIAPPHQGRGLATEAGAAVLRFGFGALGLHKLRVGCITENTGSRRVIEKLGFRLLCEQRDHMFRHGRWWGHLAYEMVVDEWPGAKGG